MVRATRARSLAVIVLLGVPAMFADACGGDDAPRTRPRQEQPAAQGRSAVGFGHIHGLGVTGDSLFIASHEGLFRAPGGNGTPEQVDQTGRDIMGFSVVSPGRFVGSGHPGPGREAPSNLGLIESRDGGKAWKSISLLGRADFHVLRAAGSFVYGFDAGSGFMTSRDRGRTWARRAVPAAMFDLALDATDPERLITATQAGLFTSDDGGRRWRPINQQVAGLLASPRRGRLFLVDADGTVQRSGDGGRSFTPVGTIGGQPAAFIADRRDLYAALADGTVKRSSDGGATWSVRTAF